MTTSQPPASNHSLLQRVLRHRAMLVAAGGMLLVTLLVARSAGLFSSSLGVATTHLLSALAGGLFVWSAVCKRQAGLVSAEESASLAARTEEQRQLLERLDMATEAAGIGVWDWDLVNNRLATDSHMAKIFRQLDKNEFPDARDFVKRTIHPEDLPEFERVLVKAIKRQDHVEHNYRTIEPDGSLHFARLTARIFRDETGRAVRMLSVTVDTTKIVEAAAKMKQQAEDLQKLVERFNLATQAAGVSVWEWDIGGQQVISDASRAFSAKMSSHVDPRYFLEEVLLPEDREDFRKVMRRALAREEEVVHRYRIRHANGEIISLQLRGRIFRDANQRATRVLGVTTNITDQTRAAAEIQRHTERQQILLDRLDLATRTAGIGVWDMDMVTRRINADLRLHQLLDLTETSQPLDENRLMDTIHPEDRTVTVDAIRSAVEASEHEHSISVRHRIQLRTGQIRHIQTHIRVFRDDTGKAISILGVTWDVSEEVEHAQQLKQQAERVQTLLDRFAVAIQTAGISPWEVDARSFKFTWAENRSKVIGNAAALTAEEYGLAISELIHPDDHCEMRTVIRDAVDNGQHSYSYRYRLVRPDGLIRHMQSYAHIIRDECGQPLRLLGATIDITNEVQTNELLQRQAEQEIKAAKQLEWQALQLRDAERRLERASLSSSEGHWELDLATDQIWLSSSYHTLLGYSEGELPTQYGEFCCLQHPEDAAYSDEVFQRHIHEGIAYDIEVRMQTATEGYRWFRRRGTAERDASGKAVRMAGSIHDIHQQKLAEDALKLAQRRFERAIHGTQDGLWELEAGGAAWCSPRLGALLGFEPDEFAADTNFLRRYLHPDDANAVALATQAHFQQELPYDVEIRLHTKSGDYRWYRARATAERDATGRPLRLSGSLQDVSEARAARDELMQATEAAEAANRAKSEFLANVSHEIRTPMNGIIGMTGLLLDTHLDRTQRDYADTIRGSADSLLIVINDILDFSKIEAGRLDLESIELELRSNVEEVGGMMAFQAATKNLELVVHVHPDVPERVIGDPQRLRQCLINLVGNAVKFTREGEIVIEVRAVGYGHDTVLTRFEVRDTGIGIARETLDSLFQPFVQADSSTTRHFGGTGLGLSIVRRLVEMMGGQVGVDSTVGKGSTFWFILPLQSAEEPSMHAPVHLTRLGRRLLVVDDNETNRRVLAGQLIHAGFEVSLASSGHEAVQMLQVAAADQHPFEVVLADYALPDMDGAALGETINSDPQLCTARVVILTSVDRHGDIRRFASMGFAGYLTKPVRARELFDCMDRVLACDAKQWHLQSQPMVTKSMLATQDAQRRYNGHVLLVEDNAVNQKVAVRFLERMGCKVRVADNGAEGVKAFQEMAFDIVLMDLQMPVMDGLTATRRIRELENGVPPTPIVALTANAMAGQLDRCMEAGMNSFLTKPLDVNRLHETLERYGLNADAIARGNAAGPSSPATAPVNLGRLHELTDGDTSFAHELAETFMSSGAQVMQEIHEGMAAFDRSALARAAHKLKGASANVHADTLRDLAYTLETQAGAMDRPRLTELIEQVAEEFNRAAEFLKVQVPEPEARVG